MNITYTALTAVISELDGHTRYIQRDSLEKHRDQSIGIDSPAIQAIYNKGAVWESFVWSGLRHTGSAIMDAVRIRSV